MLICYLCEMNVIGLEVPAFAAAIEAHLKRVTDAIINHALEIATQKNVSCFL